MRRIKVLPAKMPHLVRGLLSHLLRSQTDLEVVDAETKGPWELLNAVKQTGADVVVEVLQDPEQMAARYAGVFDEYPDVVILALALDEKTGALYRRSLTQRPVNAVSMKHLMELIRGRDLDEE